MYSYVHASELQWPMSVQHYAVSPIASCNHGWPVLSTGRRDVEQARPKAALARISLYNDFGWQDVGVELVKDLSENELKRMLESVAWRRVRKEWSQELENKPKLLMLKKIAEYEEESNCANVKMKSERRVLIKLREVLHRFKWRRADGMD